MLIVNGSSADLFEILPRRVNYNFQSLSGEILIVVCRSVKVPIPRIIVPADQASRTSIEVRYMLIRVSDA